MNISIARLLLLLTFLMPSTGHAAEADYYRGKSITVICGYGVGGGYDAYARLLARHLADHIPGRPTIVVQNMPGAGGMRAANLVYTGSKDGTVIAALNPLLLMYQLLGGPQARYETAKLQWIGTLDEPNNSIIAWSASGIRTIEDAKARDVPVPGDGPTSAMSIYPTAANALLGTRCCRNWSAPSATARSRRWSACRRQSDPATGWRPACPKNRCGSCARHSRRW